MFQFHSLTWSCSVFPAPLILRDCLFPITYCCLLCHRLIDHGCLSLFLGSRSCSMICVYVFVPVWCCCFFFERETFFFYCSGFCHTLKWNSHGFYMCSPSRSPLPPPSPPDSSGSSQCTRPPPSPPDSSGSSQCTRPEHLSHASNLGWWSVSP